MSHSRKPPRGAPVARESHSAARRDPRAETGESPPSSRPPFPGVVLPTRRSLQRPAAPSGDLAAELASEREARARDATTLGEMFVRVCDADAKRRMSELAADALGQRVASLESELRELRMRGGASDATAGQASEARARELQERLYAAEERGRALEEKLRLAEARVRDAEGMASRLEHAALAAKHDASGTGERIASLESELLALRSGATDGTQREQELQAHRAEALARATEIRLQRARITELERGLANEKEEHARTAMRLTVADTRVEELTAQSHDFEQRAFAAEWESEKAVADAEAAKRRATALEAELARLAQRAAELEGEVEGQRRATEQAEKLVVARLGDLEGARAAEVTARAVADQAELARAAMESALRSIVSELDEHEARAADLRGRTLARARDVLAATPRPTSASVSDTPSNGSARAKRTSSSRDDIVTPLATPRSSVRNLARLSKSGSSERPTLGKEKPTRPPKS